MHAYLLASRESLNSKPEILNITRKHKAKILPFTLQKIEDVRELRKLVKLSFPQKTAIVIKNFDDATIETQNAFLKNLEEPQKNLVYILTAYNLDNVLPTIISRCEIIKLPITSFQFSNNVKIKIQKFQTGNIDYKFELINKIKDRKEAQKFVSNLIFFDHKNKDYKNQENYLYALTNLKSNGNVALQLTAMLVKMNRYG